MITETLITSNSKIRQSSTQTLIFQWSMCEFAIGVGQCLGENGVEMSAKPHLEKFLI